MRLRGGRCDKSVVIKTRVEVIVGEKKTMVSGGLENLAVDNAR